MCPASPAESLQCFTACCCIEPISVLLDSLSDQHVIRRLKLPTRLWILMQISSTHSGPGTWNSLSVTCFSVPVLPLCFLSVSQSFFHLLLAILCYLNWNASNVLPRVVTSENTFIYRWEKYNISGTPWGNVFKFATVTYTQRWTGNIFVVRCPRSRSLWPF